MDNLSWFGYPNDAYPSVRNLVPGLEQVRIHQAMSLLLCFAQWLLACLLQPPVFRSELEHSTFPHAAS